MRSLRLFIIAAVIAAMSLVLTPAQAVRAVGVAGAMSPSVLSAAKKAEPGTLKITIRGLKGRPGQVKVRGPGLRRSVAKTKVLTKLRPGIYRVSASSVRIANAVSYPVEKKFRVRVSKRAGARVNVDYAIKVSKRTVVVAPKAIASVKPTGEDTYSLVTKADVAKGDIVAAGVGANTPYGLLVKVTDVDGKAVQARQARIDEAIPQGEFDVSFTAPVDEPTQAARLAAGAGPRGKTSPYSCNVAAQAGLEAGVYGEVPVSFAAGWGGGDPYVRVRADLRAGAYAKAWAKGQVSCTIDEKHLFGKTLAVITVWVGPVPLVFVPRVDAYAGGGFTAKGEATAQASVSVNGYAQLTAYRNRLVPETQEPTFDNGFDYQGSAELNGNVYGRVRVTVDVYGVAGPNVNLTLQPEITAATNQNPWWTAGLRVMAGAGIKVDKCLKVFWKEYCARFDAEKTDIFNKYVELGRASGAGGGGGGGVTPPKPVPTPTPTPVYPAVSFAPLTFDEYYTYGQDYEVSDMWIDRGVRFADAPYPILSWDSAQPTAPVLSGQPRFNGPIEFFFQRNGSKAVSDAFSFDIGYLNDIGSIRIQWFDVNGKLLGSKLSTKTGIEHVYVKQAGVHRVTVGIESEEGAGFSLDNLAAGSNAVVSAAQAEATQRSNAPEIGTR